MPQAHDAGPWERAGMVWLALGCVALGLLPVQFIQLIDPVTRQLVAAGLGETVAADGWLLVPVDVERASYGPVIFLLGVAASFALAFLLVRRLYHGRLRRAAPWDCGFPWQTARMQDTAEGFGQPIRQIFEPFFRMQRELPSPFDAQPRYRVVVDDHFWHWLYLPVADFVERAVAADRPAAAGPDRGLPAVQLPDADRACCCWCGDERARRHLPAAGDRRRARCSRRC